MTKLTKQQIKNRKTWTNALRSKMYNQTEGVLRSNEGHCCLGVACDVLIGKWSYLPDTYAEFRTPNGSDIDLDEAERRKIGLTHQGMLALMKINDANIAFTLFINYPRSLQVAATHLTFEEIADLIDYDTLARAEGWSLLDPSYEDNNTGDVS